jgi:hypothetical protein
VAPPLQRGRLAGIDLPLRYQRQRGPLPPPARMWKVRDERWCCAGAGRDGAVATAIDGVAGRRLSARRASQKWLPWRRQPIWLVPDLSLVTDVDPLPAGVVDLVRSL